MGLNLRSNSEFKRNDRRKFTRCGVRQLSTISNKSAK